MVLECSNSGGDSSMRLIILDTETTGLPGTKSTTSKTNSGMFKSQAFRDDQINKVSFLCKGEVIQFSALVCNEDTLMPEEFISFYCMPTEPISDDAAFKVHGIKNEDIYKLSGGKYLEDYLFNPREKGGYSDIFNAKGNVYMSYGIDFDTKAINDTLAGYSMEVDFGKRIQTFTDFKENKNYHLCLMKSFRSIMGLPYNVKLVESLRLMKFDSIDEAYKKIMKKFNKDANAGFHNADYDTVAAWTLFYQMRAHL